MRSRLELHDALCACGTTHVYFQPPETIRLEYPCIIYELSDKQYQFADDGKYSKNNRFTVTAIDKNPESSIPDEIEKLPMTSFDRFFTSDNLNHFVFSIYI